MYPPKNDPLEPQLHQGGTQAVWWGLGEPWHLDKNVGFWWLMGDRSSNPTPVSRSFRNEIAGVFNSRPYSKGNQFVFVSPDHKARYFLRNQDWDEVEDEDGLLSLSTPWRLIFLTLQHDECLCSEFCIVTWSKLSRRLLCGPHCWWSLLIHIWKEEAIKVPNPTKE